MDGPSLILGNCGQSNPKNNSANSIQMAKYSVGDKVVDIKSLEKGMICEVGPAQRGRQRYTVNFGGEERDVFEPFIKPDCDITDAYARCKANVYDAFPIFSRNNTSFKIKNSNNSTISSLKASRTMFQPYQYKPLLKFLNSPSRRLLIADEVGLGKTIEAGHIMMELKARRELKNVLIICPKSLIPKWQDELEYKFGLMFKSYDNANDFMQDFRDRNGVVHGILNYEKLMYNPDKEKTSKIIKAVIENEYHFSLVICDESHRLRNRHTMYHGVSELVSRTDAAIFMSATPVMMRDEDLYNQLHLLDPDRYNNYEIFSNLLRENAPFVYALTGVNQRLPLPEIAEKLRSSVVKSIFTIGDFNFYREVTIDEKFASYPIYNRIIRSLTSGEDTDELRAQLQYDLSSMSVMNNIFSRSRKVEVKTEMKSYPKRNPQILPVILEGYEKEMYDKVIEDYIDSNSYTYDGVKYTFSESTLGLIKKKEQIASSVFAHLNKMSDLEQGIDAYEEFADAKFSQLLSVIKDVESHNGGKVIVFATYIPTIKYLQIRLKKHGYENVAIYGGIKNRKEVIDEFHYNPNIKILVSSEVGSEGLDMQFCNTLINYDLPWNPMVVEQRIGRVDRFGQEAEVVNIYNILVDGSIQNRIFGRLFDRIGLFRGTVGDMDAILNAEIEEGKKVFSILQLIENMKNELYAVKLTPEERERKIEKINLAIENQKVTISKLEEGLNNSLTNDAFFKQEIERILKNNAYVTETEILNYVRSIIKDELTTCDLVDLGGSIYELRLPKTNLNVLQNFLTAYRPASQEYDITFGDFKRQIRDKSVIRLTFNQQVAYSEQNLFHINIYHPIVVAALQYYTSKSSDMNSTFNYGLNSDDVLHAGDSFYLAIYRMSNTYRLLGAEKNMETLYPLVYNIKTQELITNRQISDRIFSRSQTEGFIMNKDLTGITSELIESMRDEFLYAISEEKNNRSETQLEQILNDQKRESEQSQEYYTIRINRIKDRVAVYKSDLNNAEIRVDDAAIKKYKGLLARAEGELRAMENKRDEDYQRINADPNFSIKEKLVSLSLINVI